jgi:hypothetical protein
MYNITVFEPEQAGTPTAKLQLQGQLAEGEYDQLTQRFAELINRYGEVDLLVDTFELAGYTPQTLWHDMRFTSQHRNDFRRVAVVSDATWQKWLVNLADPIVAGEVAYFTDYQKAEQWLER